MINIDLTVNKHWEQSREVIQLLTANISVNIHCFWYLNTKKKKKIFALPANLGPIYRSRVPETNSSPGVLAEVTLSVFLWKIQQIYTD